MNTAKNIGEAIIKNRRREKEKRASDQRRLSELLYRSQFEYGGEAPWYDECAEYLIKRGVVVLPCGIGTKMYETCYNVDDGLDGVVAEITVTEVGQKYLFFSEYAIPRDDANYSIPIEEIGKTLFFSREEAEKAIKRRLKRNA